MRTSKRLALIATSLVLCFGSAPDAFAEEGDWAGVWVTDEGALTLEHDGDSVTGSYGRGASIEATVSGDKLEGTYRSGNVNGRVEFEMQSGGNHFTGKWIHPRGNSGTWRGWRSDPKAEKARGAKFGGHWLTSIGTFQLVQKGTSAAGAWRHAGRAEIDGEIEGRRWQGTLRHPTWAGELWLEMTPEGDRIFGLTNESPPAAVIGVRVEEHEHNPKLRAGEISQGIAANGMLFHIRPPDGWRKGRPVDTIVLLHGSNWTTAGMVWVTAKNWPELAENYMIVGIQGDQWASWSDVDDLRFNYHYVNWMGRSTYQGYPNTDRDSPYLVSQVVEELGKTYKWKRTFLGGHSQGGYLAHILHMHSPEQFAGVFPIACGLVMQAEPDVFEDEDLKAAQRATPLAILHGSADSVVAPSSGLYSRDRFEAHGFELSTLMQPDRGHGYDFLPIGDVIAWLDAMSTEDDDALVAYATKAIEDERYEHAGQALRHAGDVGLERKLAAVSKALDKAAAEGLEEFTPLVEAAEGGDWVDRFVVWRRKFRHAPAAAALMEAWAALRAEHEEPAEALYKEGRQAMRDGDRSTGLAKYREATEKYFAAGRYPLLRRWTTD